MTYFHKIYVNHLTMDTTTSKDLIWSFVDRSVLIDADQAEFFLELKQKYMMTFTTILIYFVGVDDGVFEIQQVGKLQIEVFLYIFPT